MDAPSTEWGRTGGTLSDKPARDTFGLTEEEIIRAIRAGKLQYRDGSMHGNPWLRFLRREMEALVAGKHGTNYLKQRQMEKELKDINSELRKLKTQITRLDARKTTLIADLGI